MDPNAWTAWKKNKLETSVLKPDNQQLKLNRNPAYWNRDIRQPRQMDEDVRNKPHPVSCRQEKSVLALDCNSAPSGSAPFANRNRRQTNAGKGNDV